MAMRIMAAISPNLFASPPPNPRINHPSSQNAPPPPPPLPLPIRRNRNPNPNPNNSQAPPPKSLKSFHSRTKYHKPLPSPTTTPAVISSDGDRSVVLGDSGISYLLPGAPFEFQFSYSETPKAAPLAIREPAFLPFAPPTMNRPWTGKAPLISKKDKERKRKIRLFEPLGVEEGEGRGLGEKRMVRIAERRVEEMARCSSGDGRSREEVLGEPLTKREVRELVRPWLSKNRQVNLGRDGLTHNMLEMIHGHWKRQEVCKVRCRGVPTIDMDNVCYHLEEKTGGKIIHRIGGVLYLFRGRNYNPRTRPRYPIMLWKPAAPVYPKLIEDAPDGLSKTDADEFRRKGKKLLPICKLAKNGIYMNLVKDVKDAFEGSPLVKVNCQGMHASDYKKIGAKLKELVPCVLLSFDEEQILIWRGKNWKPRYQTPVSSIQKLKVISSGTSPDVKGLSNVTADESITHLEVACPKMFLRWKHAIDSQKALLLNENYELSPDSLLEKVKEFQGMSQAVEHSYPALILAAEKDSNVLTNQSDYEFKDMDKMDVGGSLEEVDPVTSYGRLPIDSIVE